MKSHRFALVTLLLASACQTTSTPPPNAAPLTVDVTWTAADRCSAQSPAFTIGPVPAETKNLRFDMVDLDAPTFYHGGGTVPYAGGSAIPAGAFRYQGPCPPGGSHRYEWTVNALDEKSAVVARGKVVRNYP